MGAAGSFLFSFALMSSLGLSRASSFQDLCCYGAGIAGKNMLPDLLFPCSVRISHVVLYFKPDCQSILLSCPFFSFHFGCQVGLFWGWLSMLGSFDLVLDSSSSSAVDIVIRCREHLCLSALHLPIVSPFLI